jgi:hypothetical protein
MHLAIAGDSRTGQGACKSMPCSSISPCTFKRPTVVHRACLHRNRRARCELAGASFCAVADRCAAALILNRPEPATEQTSAPFARTAQLGDPGGPPPADDPSPREDDNTVRARHYRGTTLILKPSPPRLHCSEATRFLFCGFVGLLDRLASSSGTVRKFLDALGTDYS